MNERWREWDKKFWSNIGLVEILRFGCASLLWLALGVFLSGYFRSPLLLIAFMVILFLFVILGLKWRPVYLVNRKILGNKNLPTEPMPAIPMPEITQPRWKRPWYAYLPGIGFLILDLVILYIILRGRGR